MAAIPYSTTSQPSRAREVELTHDKVVAAVRAFFRAMEAWGVDNHDARVLLGRPGRATYFQWKKGEVKKIPFDTVRRISYLLGIWRALQILFKDPARADAWIKKPNALFGGRSALERMLGGDVIDLAVVRGTLDSVRGGGL